MIDLFPPALLSASQHSRRLFVLVCPLARRAFQQCGWHCASAQRDEGTYEAPRFAAARPRRRFALFAARRQDGASRPRGAVLGAVRCLRLRCAALARLRFGVRFCRTLRRPPSRRRASAAGGAHARCGSAQPLPPHAAFRPFRRPPHTREPPPRLTLAHSVSHARHAPCQPSHKSFKIKRILGKKQKQNRPIPQWIRLRTDNTIRCAAATGWLAGACCAAAALRCAASAGGFALQCCLARLRFGRLPPGSVAVIAR